MEELVEMFSHNPDAINTGKRIFDYRSKLKTMKIADLRKEHPFCPKNRKNALEFLLEERFGKRWKAYLKAYQKAGKHEDPYSNLAAVIWGIF